MLMKKLTWILTLASQLAFAADPIFSDADVIPGVGSDKNYVKNSVARFNTAGWTTYADAAGTSPVDCTGGSPNVTISRSTTTPLRPPADFNFVKDGSNRQGQGWAYAFTIDGGDSRAARIQQISHLYEVVSGTYATGDVTVWIYDVTNSVLIQPAASSIESVAVAMPWQGTFQPRTNSTSYRLCLHVSSTSSSAYTLAATDFRVRPQRVTQGTPVSDWTAYTTTITHNSGGATNYTAIAKKRRIGDSMEVVGTMLFSGAPASFSEIYASTPSDCTIDTAKINQSTDDAMLLGYARPIDSGTASYTLGPVTYATTTTVRVRYDNASGVAASITGSLPFSWGNGDSLTWRFTIPCLGASSQVQMSSETDGRVVAARYTSAAGQSIANGATPIIDFATKDFDTHGAVTTGASWKFTAPFAGVYEACARLRWANGLSWTQGNYANAQLYKNGSAIQTLGEEAIQTTATLSTGPTGQGCDLISLNGGDYIDIRGLHAESSARALLNSGSHVWVSIRRVSGPSQIASSEIIAARYTRTSNQTLGATAILDLPNKIIDTHDSVTTGASWKFTAKAPGLYRACAQMTYFITGLTGEQTTLQLYKNGSTYGYLFIRELSANATTLSDTLSGCDLVSMVTGDYIDFRPGTNATTSSTIDSGGTIQVTIERLRN